MYGDLALIQKNPTSPPQTSKGFYDESLTKLINSGIGNKNLLKPIIVSNRDGGNAITYNNSKDLAEEYLSALALAHECVYDVDKKGNKIYQGPSPDEIALV